MRNTIEPSAAEICIRKVNCCLSQDQPDYLAAIRAIEALRDAAPAREDDKVSDNASIARLGLSTRTADQLEIRGVLTVADLELCTVERLRGWKNFGPCAVEEITRALKKVGRRLLGS